MDGPRQSLCFFLLIRNIQKKQNKLNTIKQTDKPILRQFFAAKCKSCILHIWKVYRIFIFHPILICFFLLLNEMCYMLSEVCWQFLQSFTEQHPLFFFTEVLLYWVTIEHQILCKNECNNLSLNLDFNEHWTQTYIWIIRWVIQTQVSL